MKQITRIICALALCGALAACGPAPGIQALRSGDASQVKAEIRKGADAPWLLWRAAYRCNIQEITVLIEAGADVNATYLGRAALHQAAEEGCTQAITLLVEAGADIHATDNRGRTPLGAARLRKQWSAADLLQELARNR